MAMLERDTRELLKPFEYDILKCIQSGWDKYLEYQFAISIVCPNGSINEWHYDLLPPVMDNSISIPSVGDNSEQKQRIKVKETLKIGKVQNGQTDK